MGRESLSSGHGMLFVMETDEMRSFWMKDTFIPLDIIFIDGNGVIVDIQTMIPCVEEPCEIYKSAAPARYVLEINAGESAGFENGMKVIIPASVAG